MAAISPALIHGAGGGFLSPFSFVHFKNDNNSTIARAHTRHSISLSSVATNQKYLIIKFLVSLVESVNEWTMTQISVTLALHSHTQDVKGNDDYAVKVRGWI